MPILPDDQFENYLKQFCPLPPERLPLEKRFPKVWRPPTVAALAAVAALVIGAFLITFLHGRASNRADHPVQWAGEVYTGNSQPLTIQSANALLIQSPSFEAAVNAMAIPSHTTSVAGKQSALDTLSKDSKP